MTIDEAKAIAGTLSNTTKMPGYSWGIPATACKQGSKLRKIPGSTCSKCYALKGFYVMPNVRKVLDRRLTAANHPQWAEAMATLILAYDCLHFRWFDSGDIQSPEMLRQIFEVCRKTPYTRHWLPTREHATVKQVCKTDAVPENLVIRWSVPMIDGSPPRTSTWPTWSSVTSIAGKATCPAPQQGNACVTCRLCWDKDVPNIIYKQH